MIGSIAKKIFGSAKEREIKRLVPKVLEVNALEAQISKLTDEGLRNKTAEFREKLSRGATLNDILAEAFAVTREAGKRVLNMRHFDVQLIGGMVLHSGKVAEMRTGEGKTLVATLPVYLNALEGKGVHVVTVNDYLAKRDSEWMGQLYRFLGLSVGTIVHGLNDRERHESYSADITYGTNNEFGFDYLRDNMKFRLEDFVQRPLNFAIVDEVDSILIDEARTPLIISGPTDDSTDKYYLINSVIPILQNVEDYTIEEKSRSVALTESGVNKIEKALRVNNLYAPEHMELVHHVHQGLKAHAIFKRDVDYVVKEGEVIIVDEFTGRLMPGRRYSDGLHQALEAKEGVNIENENQTLATVTFQNYFRMYKKLAGMTGTADTEATEFNNIYKLEVCVIPTNRPMVRDDKQDVIYKTAKAKYKAVCDDIEEMFQKKKPVLVGTISIEKSEYLSQLLKKRGVPHNVLNAKQHEREAEIVVQAGQPGAITIATNMAGRGTDIVLGPGVKEMGGLHIIGTERHESRRIDNQLRGRAGRQGDPGSSRFYLSLEDDLLRIFQGEKIKAYMDRFKMEEEVPIESKLITKAIENAQKKVEGHNYDIRKHLLEYDDVLNKQREVVYELRRLILKGENTKALISDIVKEQVDTVCNTFASVKLTSDWDTRSILESILTMFDKSLGFTEDTIRTFETKEALTEEICKRAQVFYDEREKAMTPEVVRQLEQMIYLGSIDQLWKDHLLNMDHLKEGVGLRGYGQKDPLVEYKKEGFTLFKLMDDQVKMDVITKLYRVQVTREEEVQELQPKAQPMHFMHGAQEESQLEPTLRKEDKVGRNDPCPCGSGKKYKKCHGG
ncbi:MAG: preprotein translocase subunit SecA [Deltaproteobacteria bacterium]